MRELTERNSAALCRERKLLLVLDLDHTVIHATVDSKVKNLVHKDAFRDSLFEIKLPGSGNAGSQSHFVKLRPYAREFIKSLNEFFQIQVFTWGLRHYAEQVVRILDPEDEIIKSRIVSRDDVFDPSDPSGHRELQQKELSRLFPCDEKMAIIIDDDPRVWSKVPRNLMRIPKCKFSIMIILV